MNKMFSYCRRLTNIDVSNFDTKNVQNFGGMFEGLHKVYELDLTSFDFQSGDNFQEMFHDCRNLSVINIKNNSKNIEYVIEQIPEIVNISYVNS